MFGQYKYFTYKMASNYIYKEKEHFKDGSWVWKEKSSFTTIKKQTLTHAYTQTLRKKFGPEFFLSPAQIWVAFESFKELRMKKAGDNFCRNQT